jgi:hypothetical protein
MAGLPGLFIGVVQGWRADLQIRPAPLTGIPAPVGVHLEIANAIPSNHSAPKLLNLNLRGALAGGWLAP